MSFIITTDVSCDNCPDWVHGCVSTRILKAKALKRAKQLGWKKIKGAVLCPRCARPDETATNAED
jgi:hypothetical protein